MTAASPGATARSKLIGMRAALIDKLDRHLNGGDLALVASVQLAIIAIDDVGRAAPEAPQQENR
ncbi:MAG TPA: hypothetical protein VGM07_13975 [Stellaceae bacterium]